MRILLVGEYSRLHNSLKEGLTALGHQVNLLGSGDGFKDFPVDIKLERRFTGGLGKKFKLALLKMYGFDISEYLLRREFRAMQHQLTDYDVVQLINESSFQTTPRLELEIAQFLKKHNKKLFLLSCGTDYPSVSYAYGQKVVPSIFTPLFQGKVKKEDMAPALKYLETDYQKLHRQLYNLVNGVIATDLDYHVPLQHHPKYCGLIPNPINTDRLIPPLQMQNKPAVYPIKIFHGINRNNYYKKGNDLIEEALHQLQLAHPDKVEVKTLENVPYAKYIESYTEADVLMDQLYTQDQGYNALEAMALGKTVFTGAGVLFQNHYGLQETVAIDAGTTSVELKVQLEALLEKPESIKKIGKQARNFVLKHHQYVAVAKRYMELWNSY
ncbi:glycosyltransferase [Croceiramulus getboli]|nr:glycosyltransferase [Flavobacteriaceae bacterium YJPT1-3]